MNYFRVTPYTKCGVFIYTNQVEIPGFVFLKGNLLSLLLPDRLRDMVLAIWVFSKNVLLQHAGKMPFFLNKRRNCINGFFVFQFRKCIVA